MGIDNQIIITFMLLFVAFCRLLTPAQFLMTEYLLVIKTSKYESNFIKRN